MARRFVAMGLASIPPEFPPAGVPLVELSPWWGLWPRNPRTNCLVDFGAAVFPAAASQAACLKPQSALGQAVFAALLPQHDPATAVARWTNWTVASMLDESYPGPGPLLAVLEALLRNRAESEQIEAWSQILDCAFDKAGEFPHGAEHQGIALLEAVGRSGRRALSPLVSCALQNDDEEMVFSAVACLARMGVPDAELTAEILLNRLRPEMMERARGALAFVDGALCSGDPALRVEDAAGEVECEDGTSIVGESGEHLGRAIGGGYVAGGFSPRLLPPRARLVPLGEGPIYTLEAGAEAQPLSLAGDGEVLLVGAPFQAHAGAPAGAVFRVDR